jgi:cytochrome c553
VSLIPFSSLAGLLFFTTIAAAAPGRDAEKPIPPTPEALHSKLAQISQDPAMLSTALKDGQKAASVCRHCHGVGGNSLLPEIPNLASQNAAYLLEQMNKFVQGKRKSSEFMTGMIKALTPDERINAALYLSRQPIINRLVVSSAQSATGKQMYDKVCINCHGVSGTGSDKIPRLAGQQLKYIEDSLKRYRSGSGERVDARMAGYTRNLSDADIQNLAAFLSTLRP